MSIVFDQESFPPPTLGALMRLAWVAFREQLYCRVVEAGYTDLQRVHVTLFRYPTIAGMRPGQLADQAGLSKQAINDLIRQLEKKGYVKLTPDSSDRRAKLISLTPRGSELMEFTRSAAQEVSDEWAAIVGRDRLSEVRSTLLTLLDSEFAPTTPVGLGRQNYDDAAGEG